MDRWVMDGERGMLCVHVIGYKRGYKLWYKIYKQNHMVQAVQEYLQAPSKFWIFGWNTKGRSGWRRGW